jgi:hypothetical protein
MSFTHSEETVRFRECKLEKSLNHQQIMKLTSWDSLQTFLIVHMIAKFQTLTYINSEGDTHQRRGGCTMSNNGMIQQLGRVHQE